MFIDSKMTNMVFNFLKRKPLLDRINLKDFSTILTVSNYLNEMRDQNSFLPTVGETPRERPKQGFSDFLDKLVVVDMIFGSVINDTFINNTRFPFIFNEKDFIGSQIGYQYLFQLWGHYRKRLFNYVGDKHDKVDKSNVST